MHLLPGTQLPSGTTAPQYNPENHGIGIVHFGPGAFHRAHQAVYTDDVLARHGGDWRICGVSLQSTQGADILNRQKGRYSLTIRGTEKTERRIIASISHALAATRGSEAALDLLAGPSIRIVSMTVTEKAYGILGTSGKVDTSHPAVAADLRNPKDPRGLLGLLVAGFARRKAAGLPPFTVLCCDNLPENGRLIRAGVLDFANRTDPNLAGWIAENGAFPSTMVDRITPAATDAFLAETEKQLGARDSAATQTEAFTQWVVEDTFCNSRPRWEDAGVLFVPDVAPYENMKLRMLNGTHSLIAYTGFLTGKKYVRDVMQDPVLRALALAHMKNAALTLADLPAVDFKTYAAELSDRFDNSAIAHETWQIAMDGSQKMPQRIFAPATDALEAGRASATFAVATAAWMRYCLGHANGRDHDLRDPLEADLLTITRKAGSDAAQIFDGIAGIPRLMPKVLAGSSEWRADVVRYLGAMLSEGCEPALASALKNIRT